MKRIIALSLIPLAVSAANYWAVQPIDSPDGVQLVEINHYESASRAPDGLLVSRERIAWPTYYSHTEVVEDEFEGGTYTNEVYLPYAYAVWDGALRGATEQETATVDAWIEAQEVAQSVPESVTPRQIRLALLARGITPAMIEENLNEIQDPVQREAALIEWLYANAVKRNHPMITSMGTALGLDSAGVDMLFIQAAGYE